MTPHQPQKIGILGGGQLGRMLLLAAANYPAETWVMEKETDCPAAHLCDHFVKGDIRDFDSVYAFGKSLDAITIEIEQVNTDALEKLEAEGVRVIPKPSVLRIIQNKIKQKEYYQHHQIPTAPFMITANANELHQHTHWLPAVHKIGEGGYDGRGVQLLHTREDLHKGFDDLSVLEKQIPIAKEIAVMVAVGKEGDCVLYPPVEMVFDQELNQLSYQLCPARISPNLCQRVEEVAKEVVKHFHSAGLFAVELFVDPEENVWVNETAPRVHNSGHHTIEAHYSSQFDMLCRILLEYPLGNPQYIHPSVMINLVGAKEHAGPVVYEGLNQILEIHNASVHIYGKSETRPGRKMGHITLMGEKLSPLLEQAENINRLCRVISKR